MRLVPDGIKEVRAGEFQSYVAGVRKAGASLVILIPTEIAKVLGIKRGDIVEVAIKKTTVEDAVREYGYLPRSVKIKAPKIKVKCPICGKEGTVYVIHRVCRQRYKDKVYVFKKIEVKVVHHEKRGRIDHRIPMLLFPEEYARFLRLWLESKGRFSNSEKVNSIIRKLAEVEKIIAEKRNSGEVGKPVHRKSEEVQDR